MSGNNPPSKITDEEALDLAKVRVPTVKTFQRNLLTFLSDITPKVLVCSDINSVPLNL